MRGQIETIQPQHDENCNRCLCLYLTISKFELPNVIQFRSQFITDSLFYSCEGASSCTQSQCFNSFAIRYFSFFGFTQLSFAILSDSEEDKWLESRTIRRGEVLNDDIDEEDDVWDSFSEANSSSGGPKRRKIVNHAAWTIVVGVVFATYDAAKVWLKSNQEFKWRSHNHSHVNSVNGLYKWYVYQCTSHHECEFEVRI